jgi:hypothetical protein
MPLLTEGRDPGTTSEAEAEPRTKKEKKAAALQREEMLKKELNLLRLTLSPQTLGAMTFHTDFESMVLPALTLLLNSVFMVLVFYLTGFTSPLAHLFTLAVLLITAFTCVKVEITSEVSENVSILISKANFFVVGAVGTAAAAFILWGGSSATRPALPHLFQPDQGLLIDFGFDAARSSIDASSKWLKTKLEPSASKDKVLEAPFYSSDGTLLILGLSLLSGFMASGLYSCGRQYSRCLHFMLSTPSWGSEHMLIKKYHLWLSRIGLVLPMSVVAIQFRPMANYWGIQIEWLPQVQAILLALIALVQATAVPGLCQAWLNSGLLDWYVNTHSGTSLKETQNLLISKCSLSFSSPISRSFASASA